MQHQRYRQRSYADTPQGGLSAIERVHYYGRGREANQLVRETGVPVTQA